MNRRRVPGAAEWAGYEQDLDVRYAHKLFFGKAIHEVLQHFTDGVRCIGRADELLFMPRGAFQYYVFAFAEFVRSDAAVGDSDAASSFLHLLISRERKDPGSVKGIYPEIRSISEFVSANQERFAAPRDIYGSFEELGREIENLCA